MSEENVDAFKRGLRRDIEALLEELDPNVEWHPALAVLLGGEQTVFRGHEGVRESIREEDEALAEYRLRFRRSGTWGIAFSRSGTPVFAAKGAGCRSNRPFCALTESKGTKGKATRATSLRTYLDPKEALEAAGLSE
jgi:hypothetical protein